MHLARILRNKKGPLSWESNPSNHIGRNRTVSSGCMRSRTPSLQWIVWSRIRVTIPSGHLERVMTSPEVQCDIEWCHELDSNQPHTDFQSAALPDELPRRCLVPRTRIELVINGYQPFVIPFNYPGKTWSIG